LLYILVGVFLSISCLVWVSLRLIFGKRILIGLRLEELQSFTPHNNGGIEDELQTAFKDRIYKPMLQKASAFTQKYTPLKQRESTEKKLINAGRPLGWSASDFISVQYATAAIFAIVAYILSSVSQATSGVQYMATVWGFIGGYVLLFSFLKVNISRRQAGIEKELPDVLDLLTISIEAGLGFDAALQRVVQKSQGPLAQEFSQSLQEMRMGKTRKEALRDLGLRNDVGDLNNFVGAIIQADQLGVSMGNVLRTQSEQMRVIRRQRVEEKAMKAPIKMLIPMVLFIFPTIFLILLGPSVLQIMETMK
jgi:tight adherence protein C